MTRKYALGSAGLAIAWALLLAIVWPRSPSFSMMLDYKNVQLIETGAQLYKSNCASCHGANLEGQPNWRSPGADMKMPAPPHDASGHTWHHTDQMLFRLTKYGLGHVIGDDDYKSNMPAYENVLTDQEIIAVLTFIKSRWPENIQRRHDQLNLQSNED